MRIGAMCGILLNDAQLVIRKAFYNHLVYLSRIKHHKIDLFVSVREYGIISKSNLKEIFDSSNITIINYGNYCEKDIRIKLYELENYDCIYCIGVLTNKLDRLYERFYKLDTEEERQELIDSINFNSTKSLLKKVIPILHFMKQGTPVVQYIVDWQESKLNKISDRVKQISYYENKQKNWCVEKFNMYQYYLFKKHQKETKEFENTKRKTFYFGYTAFYASRKYVSKMMEELLSSSKVEIELNCKDKFLNMNNLVSQEEYLSKLLNAKYSLIIPSYDEKEFSMMRFYECIFQGTIPLIYFKCNLKPFVENDMIDIVNFYKDNKLIVSEEDFKSDKIVNLDYQKLRNQLYELKSIKELFSKSSYKELDISKYVCDIV